MSLSTLANPLYGIFQSVAEARLEGKTPVVVIDFDDTLSRTGPRYVLTLKAMNKEFGLGIDNRKITVSAVQYEDSFAGTIQSTLEKLGVESTKIEKIYRAKPEEKISPAEAVFFKVFFSESNVGADPFYKGASFFLTNLLVLMKRTGGRVAIVSGRADKYIELTKASMQRAGVPPELLNDSKLIGWLFKSDRKNIDRKGEVNLSFHNDKWKAVEAIQGQRQTEVVAFIDNEFRNIVQMINRLSPSKLFFARTVDATWNQAHLDKAMGDMISSLSAEKFGFTSISSFDASKSDLQLMRDALAQFGARLTRVMRADVGRCLRARQ